ncbi:unnamed protein product, partial [Heligmosomoides polygyrus]|uniref:Uncharacterized protein n=1 Tax=Heligmosomoides polygyrus TaxID=6339 RepID=A0A183FMY0_HELPZ
MVFLSSQSELDVRLKALTDDSSTPGYAKFIIELLFEMKSKIKDLKRENSDLKRSNNDLVEE